MLPILGGIGAGVIPLSTYYCLHNISEHRRGFGTVTDWLGESFCSFG